MKQNNVNRHLETLHSELSKTKTADSHSEKKVADTILDVQTLLEHTGDTLLPHHETIKERMEDSARHFDTSHPALAATIRTVVATLNNMGI